MSKKKNYLLNTELRDEILKCITEGYEKALANGFDSTLPDDSDYDICDTPKTLHLGYNFSSSDQTLIDKYEQALKNGYVPERSYWISLVRKYNKNNTDMMVSSGQMTKEEADVLNAQMSKPIVSDRLAKMFQLIVENISRSFYWSNPDDGMDCKANAVFELCSSFWKYEPADENGRPLSAFAFCSQIAYFGIAGAHRVLHPKKYKGTISMSCVDINGKPFDIYNL